jgi:hypothetical protein
MTAAAFVVADKAHESADFAVLASQRDGRVI